MKADRLKDAVEVAEDVVVPETNHLVAMLKEEGRALCVGVLPGSMLAAIELDDQATLDTAEVDDERPDRVLPPELDAHQLPITKT